MMSSKYSPVVTVRLYVFQKDFQVEDKRYLFKGVGKSIILFPKEKIHGKLREYVQDTKNDFMVMEGNQPEI